MNNSIAFIDIDETLFFTKANILVKNELGHIVKQLSNTEYNTYKLKDNETFDFREFKCSNKFVTTSKPNLPMINVLLSLLEKSEVHLLTARGDFDNKEVFLNFLKSNGIMVGHYKNSEIHVIRAGNTTIGSTADRKYNIIKKVLAKNDFTEVSLYDDAESNLDKFLELRKDFKSVSVRAFKVQDEEIFKYTNKGL